MQSSHRPPFQLVHLRIFLTGQLSCTFHAECCTGCLEAKMLCSAVLLRLDLPHQGAEPLKAVKVITCSPTAPLRQALRLMVEEHAHQLFVVDARHRPAGILTITDMLRKLTGWQPSSAAIEIPDLDEEEVEQWKADSGHDMGVESGEELVEMKRVVSAVGAFPPAGSS